MSFILGNNSNNNIVGAKPLNIKWNVVRGDTSIIQVQFLDSTETTAYDTTGWLYEAKAVDIKSSTVYNLDIEVIDNYAKITAPAATTALWGSGLRDRVAELSFDFQVTMADETVWTPILGSITVIGDVPSGVLA